MKRALMRRLQVPSTLCAWALLALSGLCECLVFVDNCQGPKVLTASTGIIKLAQGQSCTFLLSPDGAAHLLLQTLQEGSRSTQTTVCGDAHCSEILQSTQPALWAVSLHGRSEGVWVRLDASASDGFIATALEWSTTSFNCPSSPDMAADAQAGLHDEDSNEAVHAPSRTQLSTQLSAPVPLQVTAKGSTYPYYSHCVRGPYDIPQLSTRTPVGAHRAALAPQARAQADGRLEGEGDEVVGPPTGLHPRRQATSSSSDSTSHHGMEHATSGKQADDADTTPSGFEVHEAASTVRFKYAWDLSHPDNQLPHSLVAAGFALDSDWVDTSRLVLPHGLYQLHMKVEPPQLRVQVQLMHQPSLFVASFDSAVGLHASHFQFQEAGLARMQVTVEAPPGVERGSVRVELSPVSEQQLPLAPGMGIVVHIRQSTAANEAGSEATGSIPNQAAASAAAEAAAPGLRSRRLAMQPGHQQADGTGSWALSPWALLLLAGAASAVVIVMRRQ